MRHRVAATALVFTAAVTMLACGAHGDGRQRVRDTDAKSSATAVIDTVKSVTSTRESPATLTVSESTPVGVGIDSVTVWLDSTRIGSAALALGVKSPLGRYAPYGSLVAACVQTPTKPHTFVFFMASKYDSARVVEAVITKDPYETDPLARCRILGPSAQISTSLGLKLGMLQSEVERLIGKADTTSTGTNVRDDVYVMALVPEDTSTADRERRLHALVNTTLEFHNDTLVMIRIHRGASLPRYRD